MNPRHVILLFGALTWFGAIYWLAASGAFVSSRHARPVTLAVAFLTPILLFLVDVRLPGWRFAGFTRVSDRSEWPAIHWLGIFDGLSGGAFVWRVRLARRNLEFDLSNYFFCHSD